MPRRKISYEKAEAVALKLGTKLKTPTWLRGISITRDATEGFVVSVRVAHGWTR